VKEVSVGEFVRRLGLKKHKDLVLAFGYYLEKNSGVKEFSASDINNCYYEAKLETSNTSQSFILNVRSGLMMEAKSSNKKKKGRKKYTLTSSGERWVEGLLQDAEG
jgi:hypothetical protein